MKKILIILAKKNFRDAEFLVPKNFFEQQNCKIFSASTTKISIGRFGFRVKNNFLISEISPENFDAIFFVGGGGSLDFLKNNFAKNLAKNFATAKKICGAICAAPRLFLQWNLLQNRHCTGWNGDEKFGEICEKCGAIFEPKNCVVDGNFVTADGPKSAEIFAIEFLKKVFS